MNQLKPGTRTVSYGFDMGDWGAEDYGNLPRSSRRFTSSLPLANFGTNASSAIRLSNCVIEKSLHERVFFAEVLQRP